MWLRNRFPLAPCLSACLAAVAFCTWFAFRLELGLATAGFLYLVLVVLAAIYGGFWIATAASFCCLGLPGLFLRSAATQLQGQFAGILGRALRV